MKIAMIGSGAAGSVFAAYLKKGGADDITLVDIHKAHMDKVASAGLVMKDPTGEYLLKAVRDAVKPLVFFKTLPYPSIQLARLGADAGIIGAALLGKE